MAANGLSRLKVQRTPGRRDLKLSRALHCKTFQDYLGKNLIKKKKIRIDLRV